ncbi:Ig-like domain repeat protein [Nakamurella flava]|nr:Ig-like domain repeat protein [Nakamurella flava]
MNSSRWAGGSGMGRVALVGTAALLLVAGCGSGADGVRQQAATSPSATTVTAGPPAPSAAPTERSVTPGSSTASSEPAPQPAGPAASTVTGATAKTAVRYGDNSSFTLTAAAPTATPGADLTGPISVNDGSTVLAQGTTDAGGTATLAFYNTVDPGEHVYSVSYGGNAGIAPATGSLILRTTTTDVDISIGQVTGVQPGRPATIPTRVIGTPQSPTGQVTVTVDGAVVGQGAVDEQGRFTATMPAAAEGKHEVSVAYAGDMRFDPATATSSFTVTAPPVNPNQAGAAAVQASNPCPATAQACVDLTNEQAWLQSGGAVTYGPVAVTSGEAGSRTRTGTFAVFWKDKDHKSSLFNDAPMPNSVFFDGDIAFHQGSLSRQSNGCIHLSWDASAAFFDALSTGSTVTVFGTPPY